MIRQQEKPPRQYASEIIELKSRTERMAALDKVPSYLQPLVRKHVEIAFSLRTKRA
jgi:hypothetical protein